jgi:hypothetical protein
MMVITGLHKKPQGCGASVASAAGPFTTQKKKSENIKPAVLKPSIELKFSYT